MPGFVQRVELIGFDRIIQISPSKKWTLNESSSPVFSNLGEFKLKLPCFTIHARALDRPSDLSRTYFMSTSRSAMKQTTQHSAGP